MDSVGESCPRSAYVPIPGESFKFGIGRRGTTVASSQYGLGVGSTYGVAKGALSFTKFERLNIQL